MQFLFLVLLICAADFTLLTVMSSSEVSQSSQTMLDQRSEAARTDVDLENQLRAELKSLLVSRKINSIDLEKSLFTRLSGGSSEPSLLPTATSLNAADYLTNWREFDSGKSRYNVKATASSSVEDSVSFIDYAVCPLDQNARSIKAQTFRMRLGLKGGFNNAVTGNALNCVFCHARIYGNVGEYVPNLPTRFYSNFDSTKIYGNWFSTGPFDASLMGLPPFHNNGLTSMLSNPNLKPTPVDFENILDATSSMANGSANVISSFQNYQGADMPWNPINKTRSLPKFDPRSASVLAQGNLVGGVIKLVPLGGSYPGSTVGSLSSVTDGNVIIDARTVPVRIGGRIYVSGDVVLMGKFTGQGTIISGRNIYIADDVLALNPPALFDLTLAANNLRMATVADPMQTRSIANEMWGADRLTLMATNNVVIGNPFPFQATAKTALGENVLDPDKISGELRFLERVSMRDAVENDFFYEKSTGFMGQRTMINLSGTDYECLTLPWEDPYKFCNAQLLTGGTFPTNSRFKITNVLPSGVLPPALGTPAIDHDRFLSGHYVTDAYIKNFLPQNIINPTSGAMKLWITDKEWIATTIDNNPDNDKGVFLQSAGGNRIRGIVTAPMSFKTAGFNPATYNWTNLKSEVNAVFPAFSATQSLPTKYQEQSFRGGSNHYLAGEMYDRFGKLCFDYANKKITPSLPSTVGMDLPNRETSPSSQWSPLCNSQINFSNMTHQASKEKIITSFSEQYSPINWQSVAASNTLTCALSIYQHKTLPQVRTSITITTTNNASAQQLSICSSGGTAPGLLQSCERELMQIPYQECQACSYIIGYGGPGPTDNPIYKSSPKNACDPMCGCGATGTYLYYWANGYGTQDSIPTDQQYSIIPDFSLQLRINSDSPGTLDSRINSRYFNPSYNDFVGNKVARIDAFLFANQFVARNSHTSYDNSLQVNGGISSKQIMGRFRSQIGFGQRAHVTSFGGPDNFRYSAAFDKLEEIGLAISKDPRQSYSEDFIQENFGRIEVRRPLAPNACK